MICSSVEAPAAGGPAIQVCVLFANVSVMSRRRSSRLTFSRATSSTCPILRPWALDGPLLIRTFDAIELVAHPVPLRLGEHAAHLDQHHELAIEESSPPFAESDPDPMNGGAVELRAIELAPKRDGGLVDVRFQIDEIDGRRAENAFQSILLLVRKIQALHDLRPAPPLAGGQLREGGCADEKSDECESDSSRHRLDPCGELASTHDSHCTTLPKSFNSSDCHGSRGICKSSAGAAGDAVCCATTTMAGDFSVGSTLL